MSNTDTTSNSPDGQECQTCNGKGEVWKKTGVIPISDPDRFAVEQCPDCGGSGVVTTSNSSEELEKQLWQSYQLTASQAKDVAQFINREITKQKKLWWKKGWEDGRAEIEQARQQLLDELEQLWYDNSNVALSRPLKGFIQAKRSNLTKKGEQ